MIEINLFAKDERIYKVTVSGHANYAKAGSDIVCAAISMLTIATINGLTEVVGLSENDVLQQMSEGYTAFSIPDTLTDLETMKVDTLLMTYRMGVLATKEIYGDYIQVYEKNTGGESHDSNESSTLCS